MSLCHVLVLSMGPHWCPPVCCTEQKDRGLTEEKKQEILQGADESKNKLPNMTKDQISGIVDELTHNDAGEVSFHDLQKYDGCLRHSVGVVTDFLWDVAG